MKETTRRQRWTTRVVTAMNTIASRPVVAWNLIAVVINFLSAGAYLRFASNERTRAAE